MQNDLDLNLNPAHAQDPSRLAGKRGIPMKMRVNWSKAKAVLRRELVTLIALAVVLPGVWAVYAFPVMPANDDHSGHSHAVSIVGTMPYTGPTSGRDVAAACRGQEDLMECWSSTLNDLLDGLGAGTAFDALEELTNLDSLAYSQGHGMAHGLGRHAYHAYADIGLTLTNCSYKVFGGCFHGALQSYFDSLGRPVQAKDFTSVCPTEPPFAQYTCLHGLGHGLMLNTNYDLNGSLALCDALDGVFAQGSCQGGIYMENWVGYLAALHPNPAGGHDHHSQHHAPPTFHVRATDPSYPCNVAQEPHKNACWLMQTSVMLHFNGRNFTQAATVCAGVEAPHRDTCFRSLGRDISPTVNRDLAAAEVPCSVEPIGASYCIRGVLAELLLNAADPSTGLAACHWVSETFKPACYEELGWQVAGMIGRSQAEAVCARADQAHASTCLRASRL